MSTRQMFAAGQGQGMFGEREMAGDSRDRRADTLPIQICKTPAELQVAVA